MSESILLSNFERGNYNQSYPKPIFLNLNSSRSFGERETRVDVWKSV